MNTTCPVSVGYLSLLLSLIGSLTQTGKAIESQMEAPGVREGRLNNLVTHLFEASSFAGASNVLTFTRPSDGWVFFALSCRGKGVARIILDQESPRNEALVAQIAETGTRAEAVRFVARGEHRITVDGQGDIRWEKLTVNAIPELMHCGLGFDPAIKAYGRYDMEFLTKDVLPNITTLIVPNSITLTQGEIERWHRQGKRFIAEVGINGQAKTADDHFRHWTSCYEKSPFVDGIIINEFIVNRPVAEWVETMTSERLTRMEDERRQYAACGLAIRQIRADARYQDKMLYAYIGGSGKKLNQEIIGTNFLRTIIDSNYRVAIERYLHEMSSPQGSRDALQTFVDGITDWEMKEPGVKSRMVIAFGLFSMPPGSINKQPNVDYHVWMDQQMQLLATHPSLSSIAGLEWWTSSLADEETVRFVGKLYRHYGMDGNTNRLTKDPLFLTHLRNADFEQGAEGWSLRPAEPGSIAVRSFPRYGRIEGRYMGLGRPADPEHIGDTFLWMKRTAKGPNIISQTIKDLEPGRLYSMKMLSCDYEDLVSPKAKKKDEAREFIGSIALEDVDVDPKRSFSEVYPSNPEPKIPVWITYHWKVFKARGTTSTLTVSDWPNPAAPPAEVGHEQALNFLEIQPYHE